MRNTSVKSCKSWGCTVLLRLLVFVRCRSIAYIYKNQTPEPSFHTHSDTLNRKTMQALVLLQTLTYYFTQQSTLPDHTFVSLFHHSSTLYSTDYKYYSMQYSFVSVHAWYHEILVQIQPVLLFLAL